MVKSIFQRNTLAIKSCGQDLRKGSGKKGMKSKPVKECHYQKFLAAFLYMLWPPLSFLPNWLGFRLKNQQIHNMVRSCELLLNIYKIFIITF